MSLRRKRRRTEEEEPRGRRRSWTEQRSQTQTLQQTSRRTCEEDTSLSLKQVLRPSRCRDPGITESCAPRSLNNYIMLSLVQAVGEDFWEISHFFNAETVK